MLPLICIGNKHLASSRIVTRISCSQVPLSSVFFFFQAEDGIRDGRVTGVQTCALPISAFDSPLSPNRESNGSPSHPLECGHRPRLRPEIIPDGDRLPSRCRPATWATCRDRKSVV